MHRLEALPLEQAAQETHRCSPHFLERLRETGAHFVIGGGDQAYVDTNSRNDFPDIWIWLKDNKKALLEQYAIGNGEYDEGGIELRSPR